MTYAQRSSPLAHTLRTGKEALQADLAAFIRSERFPCAAAKSALSLDQVSVMEAGDFHSPVSDSKIHHVLSDFGRHLDPERMPFKTLVCGFRRAAVMTEPAFETALWERLQRLHEIDVARGTPWADQVSNDPESPDFNISIDGVAYFVIGLHPGASRVARRFCRPALVFNSHDQFEKLRADGRYRALQKVTRQRDLDVNHSINPMLANHGHKSQAAQYSGREVGEDWKCPFRFRTPEAK